MINYLAPYLKLNRKNNEGFTPIMLAISLDFFETAKHLWRKGAKLTMHDKQGRNIIHQILEKDSLNVECKQFLEDVIKAKPRLLLESDNNKRTPFHILTEKGHRDELKLVLRNIPGRKKEKYYWKKDGKEETAMDIAEPELSHLIDSFDKELLGDSLSPSCWEAIRIFFKKY